MGSSPAADESVLSRQLVDQLAREAGPDGFVPFDRYMEVVLYAEGAGYYGRPRSPLGASGDFYTAPNVTPLFGAALADHILDVRRRLGRDRPFCLIELGPGDGRLMEGVLRAFGTRPAEAEGIRVVLIERSAPLAARALERARAASAAAGIEVHARDSLGSLGPLEGVVVANELFDAQPVRRLRRSGAGWVELGVRIRDGRVLPAEAPRSAPVVGSPLPNDAPDGTVLEISPSAEGLVREVADHLVHGVFVLDDYGMDESELVAAHPAGTLEGVRGHRSGADPLATPGAVDLSTFVNLTRVRAAAARSGLALRSDLRQSEALGEWGFPKLLDAALAGPSSEQERVRLRLAVKNLLFGFGRFRVLEFVPAADRALWGPPT